MPSIKDLHERVERGIAENIFGDAAFEKNISEICSSNSVGIIIVDTDSKSLFYFGPQEEAMKIALWDKLFLKEKSHYNKILEKTNEYQIEQRYDSRTNLLTVKLVLLQP